MILCVGLGNPGKKYQNNRHNIGFKLIDCLSESLTARPLSQKFNAELSHAQINLNGRSEKILFIKPQTFMNLSGQSVKAALDYYKLNSNQVYVFHDELDLAPGKIRVKTGGGAAGHNGLRSLISHIGADFHRVRLGIGHPGSKQKVHSYVLSDFSSQERVWLAALCEACSNEIHTLLSLDNALFQSRVMQALYPVLEQVHNTSHPGKKD